MATSTFKIKDVGKNGSKVVMAMIMNLIEIGPARAGYKNFNHGKERK